MNTYNFVQNKVARLLSSLSSGYRITTHLTVGTMFMYCQQTALLNGNLVIANSSCSSF
jgi:hypothetical protein